jgi:hypothetical protein
MTEGNLISCVLVSGWQHCGFWGTVLCSTPAAQKHWAMHHKMPCLGSCLLEWGVWYNCIENEMNTPGCYIGGTASVIWAAENRLICLGPARVGCTAVSNSQVHGKEKCINVRTIYCLAFQGLESGGYQEDHHPVVKRLTARCTRRHTCCGFCSQHVFLVSFHTFKLYRCIIRWPESIDKMQLAAQQHANAYSRVAKRNVCRYLLLPACHGVLGSKLSSTASSADLQRHDQAHSRLTQRRTSVRVRASFGADLWAAILPAAAAGEL